MSSWLPPGDDNTHYSYIMYESQQDQPIYLVVDSASYDTAHETNDYNADTHHPPTTHVSNLTGNY